MVKIVTKWFIVALFFILNSRFSIGLIDGEINKLLDDAIKVSEKIIKENKSKMDGLVKVLLEKEIVEQEEFRAIMSNA